MTLAKGITSGYIPFGAVAINDRVYEGLKDHPFFTALPTVGILSVLLPQWQP
jgi:adenosylmethionine-8-amino-7-oxononanoate aminotransferase